MTSESTNAELKVTSGAQWRKIRENGHLVELPSGNVARLRPVTLETLLTSGKIPNSLAKMVAQMIRDGQYVPNEKEDIFEAAKEFVALNKLLVTEIFLEPKIVVAPKKDNEIAYEDLSAADREWAIVWAQAPTLRLANFREGQTDAVEFTQQGENV